MNNSINIATATSPKASEANASAAPESRNKAETGDSAATSGSFRESIKKAYDESKTKTEPESSNKTDKAADGKDLPVSDDEAELAAQDDRSSLPEGLYLNEQLAGNTQDAKNSETKSALPLTTENNIDAETTDIEELAQLSASTVIPANAENKNSADNRAGELSSLRQLLATEKSGDTKTRLAASNTGTGNISADSSKTENTPILSSDVPQLKTELSGLNADKALASPTASSQQQLLSSVQTSLLLQASSAQGDAGSDALSQIGNAPVNSFSQTNIQSALPQAGITQTFGQPAWAQGMGKQILMMVNQNISTAEIRLNPSHLGPIEVMIDMSDEQVSVSMSSRHAMVRDAMEQALPKLREMLEQNGFSLADADISKHSFAEQREQNTKGGGDTASNIEQSGVSEISQQAMKQVSMSSSMVDYYI